MNDDVKENNDDIYKVNNAKTTTCKYFECKTKIIGNTTISNNTLET